MLQVPAVMAQLCLKMDSLRTSAQCREFHFLHSRYINILNVPSLQWQGSPGQP